MDDTRNSNCRPHSSDTVRHVRLANMRLPRQLHGTSRLPLRHKFGLSPRVQRCRDSDGWHRTSADQSAPEGDIGLPIPRTRIPVTPNGQPVETTYA